MIQLTPPTVQAGTGLVNAVALDGVLRLIASKINALISALGVARGSDDQLADASIRPRMMSTQMIGEINELIGIIATIRRQYHPRDGMTVFGATVGYWTAPPNFVPYTEPFKSTILPITLPTTDVFVEYLMRVRIRSSGQRSLYVTMWTAMRGTVTLNGTTTVVGLNTVWQGLGPFDRGDITRYTPAELPTNPRIRINGEERNLVSVDSGTQLTVDRPFSFAGAGFVAECDYVDALESTPEPVAPPRAIMVGVFRANPPYAEMHRPTLFAVPTDDGGNNDAIFTEGREGLEFTVSDPPRRYALQWLKQVNPAVAVVVNDMYAVHDDVIIDMRIRSGATITLRVIDATNTSIFAPDTTNWPRDDDPRFPLFMRFPTPPCLQMDVLSIATWDDDSDNLLTEAGYPINGEAPTAALRI